MADDPRKGHPGHEPSLPPPRKRVLGVTIPPMKTAEKEAPVSISPTNETAKLAWEAGKRWSPAGVLVLLLGLFYAVGGKDFVTEVVGARTEITKLNATVEKLTVVVAAFEKTATERMANHEASVKKRFDLQSARDNQQDYNVSLVCDWVSDQNGGRPHESWCDSEDGRAVQFRAPPAGHATPVRVTDTRWRPPLR